MLLASLIVFLCGSTLASNYLRWHIVDKNLTTNNFIVRGDYPGSSILHHPYVTELNYDLWKEALKVVIHREAGVKLSELFIIDISLLHSYGEDVPMVKAEEEFFKKHPEHGSFIHHEINGTSQNATDLTPQQREPRLQNFTSWDSKNDRLLKLYDFARGVMNTPSKIPIVIYWHCAGGVDRTGEVSGAYYMHYLGWTMKQVFDYDTKVKDGREIGSGNSKYMNWYCFWVEFLKIRSDLKCGDW